MGDPVKEAERIVRRAGRLAPTDGGRGRELRTKWTLVRWFSWRHGFAGHRGRKWWVHVRWSIGATDHVLLGVSTYEDEDGERCVDVGCWPFRWEWGVTAWSRPVAAPVDRSDP